jgi:hypothetical protein
VTAIALPALDGRLPLGFLAALGVTRLVDAAGHAATLAWSERDASAVLHGEGLSDMDDVVGVLCDVVEQMPDGVLVPDGVVGFPPPGEAPDKLRLTPPKLRELFESLAHLGSTDVLHDWVSSLVTDLALDAQGRSAHTLYGAFSGKQSMYTMLTKPLELVRRRPELLREAIEGWKRVDGVTGEYLDHQVLFDAADSPSGESRERGVPGATWLALMSYPLIRTTSTDGRRATSTGWYTSGRRVRLRWPLWRNPLDLAAIRALWESPLLTRAARGDDSAADAESDRRVEKTVTLGKEARQQLMAIGVFHIGRAERRRIPGRNFSGVLGPVVD